MHLETVLKSNKLRLTDARRVLYDILSNSETALSAREVCRKMKDIKVAKSDEASVYRNLAVFIQTGLAHNLSNGKYVVCSQEHEHKCQNAHVIASCTRCGETKEVSAPADSLADLIKSVPGFKLISTLTLEGLCDNCSLN